MNNSGRISKEAEDVLNAFHAYLKENTKGTKTVPHGLSTLLEIPHVSIATFFSLSNETFEFEHNSTMPNTEWDFGANILPELLESGAISTVLQSTASLFFPYPRPEKTNKNLYIIPMLASEGMIGLVLLCIDKENFQPDETYIELCEILVNAFANRVEIETLKKKNEQLKEDLHQRVAARTISLVKSKKQLSDKFNDLTSNLSMSLPHEVRTPINLILGYSDYLVKHFKETEENEMSEMLTNIYFAGKRLNRLFEHYLLFANLQILAADPEEILKLQQRYTVSIEDTIYNVVSTKADDVGRSTDLQLEVQDASIAMSEEFFMKVVEELIDNALKYSKPNTPIKVETWNDEQMAFLKITDFGRGMKTDQIENMDAYIQFERKTHEQQGSGLGVAIVRRIIDLHNGDIHIESQPEEYTEVLIKIPLASIV